MQRLKYSTKQKPLKSLNLHPTNLTIPLMATIGLFAGGVAFLNPLSFVDNSYADSSKVDISVSIDEDITVPEVSQDTINLTLEPNAKGDFESTTISVQTSTNRVYGYTLTMSTEGTDTDLTSDDFDTYKIEALDAKTPLTSFADLSHTNSINKWGYATDNNGDYEGQTEAGYYYGVPSSENPATIKITDEPSSDSKINVTFATKGKDLAASTYSNVVVFSAVGNPAPPPVMQEFSVADCVKLTQWTSDGSTGETALLTDNRDGEKYPVRRLADGNCWMASNLRLTADTLSNYGHSTTLTADDTDLTSNTFTMPANATWPSDSTTTTTNGAVGANVAPTDGSTIDANTIKARGAYYTWCTATADCSVAADTGAVQADSICPKGWDLPHSDGKSYMGRENEASNYFFRLYSSATQGYDNNRTFFDTAFHYYYGNIAKTFAGFFMVEWQRIYDEANAGFWWADTARDWGDGDASLLREYATAQVDTGATTGRRTGNSVRCLLDTSS